MKVRLFALLVFLWPLNALAAEECAWLPVAQVAKALPTLGPWETMSGGEVGSCHFMGRSTAGLAMLGYNQMVQESAGKAQDFVLDMRRNLDSSLVLEKLDGMGGQAFSYRPKDDTTEDARNTLFLVGHEGRVVVMGTLTAPGGISNATRTAYFSLARYAFKLSTDEGAMDAATHCRYFNQGVLKRLFEGAAFSQQVYGSNSCIAHAGKRVLMLAIMDDVDAGYAQTMAESGGCKTEPLPALGEQGSIGYACSEGNARATVRYLQGKQHFEFSWVPGKEPGETERDLLIKLALAAREGVQ